MERFPGRELYLDVGDVTLKSGILRSKVCLTGDGVEGGVATGVATLTLTLLTSRSNEVGLLL